MLLGEMRESFRSGDSEWNRKRDDQEIERDGRDHLRVEASSHTVVG